MKRTLLFSTIFMIVTALSGVIANAGEEKAQSNEAECRRLASTIESNCKSLNRKLEALNACIFLRNACETQKSDKLSNGDDDPQSHCLRINACMESIDSDYKNNYPKQKSCRYQTIERNNKMVCELMSPGRDEALIPALAVESQCPGRERLMGTLVDGIQSMTEFFVYTAEAVGGLMSLLDLSSPTIEQVRPLSEREKTERAKSIIEELGSNRNYDAQFNCGSQTLSYLKRLFRNRENAREYALHCQNILNHDYIEDILLTRCQINGDEGIRNLARMAYRDLFHNLELGSELREKVKSVQNIVDSQEKVEVYDGPREAKDVSGPGEDLNRPEDIEGARR